MVRGIALLLTVLTGFSGLVYQVAWQKYMAVLLGSHAEATAAVLGIFLGGLSLGYALFGRVTRGLVEAATRTRQPARLLRAYGLVEAGIGIYALAFPLLFAGVRAFSLALPHGSETLGFAVDVLLTVVLIGPPTVLMGGTIPILTQGLSHDLDDATRFHSFVYAFNTVGAFTGALAAGFWIVPRLGLQGAVFAMGAVNLFAGLTFLWIGRRGEAVTEVETGAAARTPARFAVYATAAALSGFGMMALQTALNRLGGLALGASQFTFAMVVATFVLSIALGSLVVSALPRIRPGYLIVSQWLLAGLLFAAYPFVQDAAYWAHVVRIGFPSDEGAFYPYHFRIFLWSLALLVVPIGLSGATLPLIFHHLRREVADLGGVAGRLYAWNTVGSLLGALLGGYALLFWLDLHHTYRLAVACVGLGAALLTVQVVRRGRVFAPAALAALLVGLVLLPAWQPEKLSPGLFRKKTERAFSHLGPDGYLAEAWKSQQIVFYDDDPSTSVAVVQHVDGPHKAIAVYNSGKSDGQIPGDNVTMGLAALLPLLLTPEPGRAFVIGYGTGYTVGALAAIDSIEEVRVAEISPGVIEGARYFEPWNGAAAGSPKTRMERSDAYRALLRSDQRYDVIVSEPSNPWMVGVEMLFSREFLEAVRSRLTPRGIYTQWFHLYDMDDETLAIVLRTYLEAFDRVSVWFCGHSDLLILGFNDDQYEIDLDSMERRFASPDYAAEFERLGMNEFPALLAHELIPVGVLSLLPLPDRIHTILHPILSDHAARAFFKGGQAQLPSTTARAAAVAGARNSLGGRYLASHSGEARVAALEQMAREACRYAENHCITLLARWMREAPFSTSLHDMLVRLRRRSPEDAVSLSDENLHYFSRLFEERGILEAAATFESAAQVRYLFNEFYYHAVPFDARALWSAWERCSLDVRCSIELQSIRRLGVPPS